jgi:hypothetical protein
MRAGCDIRKVTHSLQSQSGGAGAMTGATTAQQGLCMVREESRGFNLRGELNIPRGGVVAKVVSIKTENDIRKNEGNIVILNMFVI